MIREGLTKICGEIRKTWNFVSVAFFFRSVFLVLIKYIVVPKIGLFVNECPLTCMNNVPIQFEFERTKVMNRLMWILFRKHCISLRTKVFSVVVHEIEKSFVSSLNFTWTSEKWPAQWWERAMRWCIQPSRWQRCGRRGWPECLEARWPSSCRNSSLIPKILIHKFVKRCLKN